MNRNHVSRHGEAGLTLVEILIAITLLSLLTGGILTAMHLGLSTMERSGLRMSANRRVTYSRRIIESEVEGMVPQLALFADGQGRLNPVRFFQGEHNVLRFVSLYSLDEAWRGRPQIVTFHTITGDDGGLRLVLDEAVYTGSAQSGALVTGMEPVPGGVFIHYAPAVAGARSFIVADKLRKCEFTYLERRPIAPLDVWHDNWVRQDVLPNAVRIEMEPLDGSTKELRVFSMTVPMVITAVAGQSYEQ